MIGTTLPRQLRWGISAVTLIAVLAIPEATKATLAVRAAAPVQLTYWYPWGGDSKTYEENRARTFNATHSDIHASGLYVPPDSGVTNGKLLSAIASGNPPDLVVVNNEYAGAVIGYQGGLTDLTPYLKTLGWKPKVKPRWNPQIPCDRLKEQRMGNGDRRWPWTYIVTSWRP